MARTSYQGGSTIIKRTAKEAAEHPALTARRIDTRPLYLQFGQWSMTPQQFGRVVKTYSRKHPHGDVAFATYWETQLARKAGFKKFDGIGHVEAREIINAALASADLKEIGPARSPVNFIRAFGDRIGVQMLGPGVKGSAREVIRATAWEIRTGKRTVTGARSCQPPAAPPSKPRKAKTRKSKTVLGTFGAGSEVRHIDPAEWKGTP